MELSGNGLFPLSNLGRVDLSGPFVYSGVTSENC
mgnify:CR=1 FL=1